MVICLERGTDLHMAQLMPLPLTVCCDSKILIGFTFLVPAHPGSPRQRDIKRLCVLLCMAGRPIHVRAQRKFALGSPCGSAAVSSPSDVSSAATDQSPLPALRKILAGRRITTDDFLTFLCLRGECDYCPDCCVLCCVRQLQTTVCTPI